MVLSWVWGMGWGVMVSGPCDFSFSPGPNWTSFCFGFGMGLGLDNRGVLESRKHKCGSQKGGCEIFHNFILKAFLILTLK